MRTLTLPALLLATLLWLPAPCAAQGLTIEQSLRANRQLAREGRDNLTRLTTRERELHSDLAQIEDELDALRGRIAGHEAELTRLDQRIKKAQTEHERLTRNQDAAYRELGGLVGSLWPLFVTDAHARSSGTRGWDDADRRFTWGAALYADARRAIEDIKDRSQHISANISAQKQLRTEAEIKLNEVNAGKDAVLGKRLAFVRRIREVRAERLNHEQALEQMLAAIEDLQYRMKSSQSGKFEDLKGALPWPVDGSRLDSDAVRDAGGRGGGGHSGAGFSTAAEAPVRAVFQGRVVHNDVLRGYGRVVILSHGDNWYSLYAFLEHSDVTQGRELSQGEPLGKTGHYPAAKGPGLYFELRFGQKAINPVHWLANGY